MRELILILLLITFSCCSHDRNREIDVLVFGQNNGFDVNDVVSYQFIPLETSDSCFISDVKQVKFIEDKIYINNNKDQLLVFDKSGKFISQIGNKGNGPGEYRLVCNFHVDKEKELVAIADGGQARVIYYSLKDYSHIETKNTFYFVDCVWLSDGNIAWFFWGGYEAGNKERYYIKITDQELKELNLLYPVDYKILNPIVMGSVFYTLNKKSYFNLTYVPTVNEVTSLSIKPIYQLDLDEHKLPPSGWMEKEAQRNYSAITNTDYVSSQNVKETVRYVSVGYCARGANAYIGFYNKETRQSCRYALPEFIRHTGLIGVGIVVDSSDDFFVSVLNASVLKRNPNSKIDALKNISEKISEEDNPILCLLKFK